MLQFKSTFEEIKDISKTPLSVILLIFYTQNLDAKIKNPILKESTQMVKDGVSEKFILKFLKEKLNDIYINNRKKFPGILNDSFFNKIALIESGNNPKAINKSSGATGVMQMTSIAIRDVYETFKPDFKISNSMIKIIKAEIIKDPLFGKKLGELYFYILYTRYNKSTYKKLIIAYDCGINCSKKKLPKETKEYWKKYLDLSKK